eukprot:scaffold50495_cov64-Phaeocystis_antarctica.AAC.5
MMTRSQTRIAQLENQVESMTKGMVDGMYQFYLKEKELQARIAELEKENEKLKEEMGVWSVLVEDDTGVGSDTFVFKTFEEADKWHEYTYNEVKKGNVNVSNVIFIPFRTFEESKDKFAELDYALEDDEHPGEDEGAYDCGCYYKHIKDAPFMCDKNGYDYRFHDRNGCRTGSEILYKKDEDGYWCENYVCLSCVDDWKEQGARDEDELSEDDEDSEDKDSEDDEDK